MEETNSFGGTGASAPGWGTRTRMKGPTPRHTFLTANRSNCRATSVLCNRNSLGHIIATRRSSFSSSSQMSAIDNFLDHTRTAYPYITVSDATKVRSLIGSIRANGLKQLHIIADYDMTLTKHWIRSSQAESGTERNLSSHGVLERGPAVSRAFADHTKKLAEHYYPYEIDSTLGVEEKTKLMVEWWSAAHQAMIDEKITRTQIREQAIAARMQFRAGFAQFVDLTERYAVPLLIFSAGIADVIEELLAVNHFARKNQSVVSNHMVFSGPDRDGALTGFREPLIHTLNKGEQALHAGPAISTDVRDALARRKNVILLGDSIGDARMADGVEHASLLKIGFLNFGDASRRGEFEATFDIVISNDESLAWVNLLIEFIGAH